MQAEAFGCDGTGLDKVAGNLLYTIASKLKVQIAHHGNFLAEYVGRKKIVSDPQLTGKVFLEIGLTEKSVCLQCTSYEV